jgi:hypothetical protein
MRDALDPYRQRMEPARIEAETVSLTLEVPSGRGRPDFIATHALEVSFAYGADGRLREVVFVGRGKVGHGLDLLLHDLGIKLSRAIQGRNPDTGELTK